VSLQPGPEDPSLRASDADRDAVADRLREAHAEGRLTVEEFAERLDAAFAARTHGDLVPLTSDLPSPTPPARRRRTGDEAQPARRGEGPSGLAAAWGAWVVVVAVNVLVWGAVSLARMDLAYFWPIWVAGPWGLVLIVATASRRGRRDGPGSTGSR
jgi:hypothetical protein